MATVAFGGHEGTYVLHALPTQAVACVELCSIKQIEQDMSCGHDVWFMLVKPASHVVAM